MYRLYRLHVFPQESQARKTRPYDGSGRKPHFWHITLRPHQRFLQFGEVAHHHGGCQGNPPRDWLACRL